VPEHIKEIPFEGLQYTMVDCPGHASLLKTIIGGAQIIDMMLLVIDITKGIQTQTAECLVIAETLMDNLIVVLNKVDMLDAAKREEKIEKAKVNLQKVFAKTRFPEVVMVPISAAPGADPEVTERFGIDVLIETIQRHTRIPQRQYDDPFLFAVDHCFPIKGQGTVLTGTVIRGAVKVADAIEFPGLGQEKKVKSMQMFKKPVQEARQGDRVGMCVAGFDPSAMERGLVAAPGTVPTLTGVLVAIEKIKFYKATVEGKCKWPITVGHSTVMSRPTFFYLPDHEPGTPAPPFSWETDYLYSDELFPNGKSHNRGTQFALLEFDFPITVPLDSHIIGSRLDADINANLCRLAFHGKVIESIDCKDTEKLKKLKIYKPKARDGKVDRVHDAQTLLVKDLFKKETDMSLFIGMKIVDDEGNVGKIEGTFGKSGKVKCHFPTASFPTGKNATGGPKSVVMEFKKYIFDDKTKMVQ